MTTKSKFEINQKCLMLTFKGHITAQELTFLAAKSNTHKVIWEIGETGYLHTHCIVMFSKKLHTRNCRYFDIGDVHPNIKKIHTKEHWSHCIVYEKSKKKENLSVKFEVVSNTLTGSEYMYMGTVRQVIQGHKRWRDVINDDSIQETVQRYLSWAKEAYASKVFVSEKHANATLRPWQKQAILELDAQNDRHIQWIWSSDGDRGKSFMGNWLLECRDCCLIDGGKCRDIALQYDSEEYVVFDLSKSMEDFSPYKAMECFKNGRISSPKYMSRLKRFNSAKIVVFANFPPKKGEMIEDRWQVTQLDKWAGPELSETITADESATESESETESTTFSSSIEEDARIPPVGDSANPEGVTIDGPIPPLRAVMGPRVLNINGTRKPTKNKKTKRMKIDPYCYVGGFAEMESDSSLSLNDKIKNLKLGKRKRF